MYQEQLNSMASQIMLTAFAGILVASSFVMHQKLIRLNVVSQDTEMSFNQAPKTHSLQKAFVRSRELNTGDIVFAYGKSPAMVQARKNFAKFEKIANQRTNVHTASMQALNGKDIDREMLLKAGFNSEQFTYEAPVAVVDEQDSVEFTKEVLQRVVLNEVEDFFEKIELASDVGKFVAKKALK